MQTDRWARNDVVRAGLVARLLRAKYGMDEEVGLLLTLLLAGRTDLAGRTNEWVADEVWETSRVAGPAYDTTEVKEDRCQRGMTFATVTARRSHP